MEYELKERNDLIRRGDAIDICEMAIDDSWEYDYADDRMFEIPAVDAVERGVFEQVAWERDIAVGQLSDIGKSFGEKMDDVAKVVRCRECVHFEPFRRHDGFCKIDGMLRDNDFFCKGGQRREDGDT